MKEQEIEKLADIATDAKGYDKDEGGEYKEALSNSDYILIEKEYIENRIKKLQDDIKFSSSFTTCQKEMITSRITELKDILSNSKTK